MAPAWRLTTTGGCTVHCLFGNDVVDGPDCTTGKLAHFYLPTAAGRQGHKVKAAPPACTPWPACDWLLDGFPPTPALDLLHPAAAVPQLPLLRRLTWVPVPHLAPAPLSCTLHGCRDTLGECVWGGYPNP
jgi:hypothetical protein